MALTIPSWIWHLMAQGYCKQEWVSPIWMDHWWGLKALPKTHEKIIRLGFLFFLNLFMMWWEMEGIFPFKKICGWGIVPYVPCFPVDISCPYWGIIWWLRSFLILRFHILLRWVFVVHWPIWKWRKFWLCYFYLKTSILAPVQKDIRLWSPCPSKGDSKGFSCNSFFRSLVSSSLSSGSISFLCVEGEDSQKG